jgi:hypothetical protein
MSSAAHIAEVLAGRKVQGRGGNYLVPCPAHEDDSPLLSLSDGDRGVKVNCFAGCKPADIYDAIRRKDRSLLESGRTASQPVKGSSEYERCQHEKAAWLWSQRRPIISSIAETYLRSRGITCPLPPTLGFLPPSKPEHHPAMIAAFGLPDELEPGQLGKPRNVNAVHLTLLKADGTGKADVDKPKLMVGSAKLPIVLAPPNDLLGLAITEGVEDALTVHQATGLGVWAAGAAGRMPALAEVVPDYIEAVTIFAHDDPAGRNGARALAEALAKLNKGNVSRRLRRVWAISPTPLSCSASRSLSRVCHERRRE